MPRKRPNRERRALAAAAEARDARRTSLLVLLTRIQHAIPTTQAEAALLRAHVEVELADADKARSALGRQQAEHRHQLAAAHTAIEEAEQHAADLAEQLLAYRAVEEQRQTIARLMRAAERPITSYERAILTTSTPEQQP